MDCCWACLSWRWRPHRSESAQTPPPIDPQNPGWQPDMTWDDYTPVPGTDWANPAIPPSVRKFKVALVVVDYPDQPFVISQPPFSTIFGNPQPLPRRHEPSRGTTSPSSTATS